MDRDVPFVAREGEDLARVGCDLVHGAEEVHEATFGSSAVSAEMFGSRRCVQGLTS